MKIYYPWLFLLLFLVPLLFSCSVTKPTYYFKNIVRDTVINTTPVPAALKIKNTDILSINISSMNKEEDEIFNYRSTTSSVTQGGASSGSNPTTPGFPVDLEGNIHIHKIGLLKVEGLTRMELKKELEKQLQPYLKDPVVTVSFANHFVTVIGEVGKPQLLPMPNESMTITDMVAQSANINPMAATEKIMLIRDKEKGVKEFKHINLEDHSIFSSSWYYLQPNDVVVVNPNEKLVQDDANRTKYLQASAIFIQALTTGLLIYQIFIKK